MTEYNYFYFWPFYINIHGDTSTGYPGIYSYNVFIGLCICSSDYRQAANIIMINPLYDIMSQTVYIITPSREEKFKSFHPSPCVLDMCILGYNR